MAGRRAGGRSAHAGWLRWGLVLVVAACFGAGGAAQELPGGGEMRHARGTFEVKLAPLAGGEAVDGVSLGRMSLDKQFKGGLEGRGQGEMQTALTAVQGSAGYVAIERFTGKLDGREGSFVLQHSGLMNRGAPSLVVTIVPDSGTGQLVGLAGTMVIEITGGEHRYDVEYSLPPG
jgi:Protein of unknown function (DUF3224)